MESVKWPNESFGIDLIWKRNGISEVRDRIIHSTPTLLDILLRKMEGQTDDSNILCSHFYFQYIFHLPLLQGSNPLCLLVCLSGHTYSHLSAAIQLAYALIIFKINTSNPPFFFKYCIRTLPRIFLFIYLWTAVELLRTFTAKRSWSFQSGMDCKEISKIGLEAVYPDVTSKAQLRMQEIVVVQNQGE